MLWSGNRGNANVGISTVRISGCSTANRLSSRCSSSSSLLRKPGPRHWIRRGISKAFASLGSSLISVAGSGRSRAICVFRAMQLSRRRRAVKTQLPRRKGKSALLSLGKASYDSSSALNFTDLTLRFSGPPSVPKTLSSPAIGRAIRVDPQALRKCEQPAVPVCDISKLCEAMAMCGMQSVLIGSFSSAEIGRMYSVHSEPNQKGAREAVSLREILRGSYGSCRGPRRSDRFRIALAIASSHLQLQSTPWARRQWEAGDIYFPKDLGGSIMFYKPYVSASFAESLAGAEKMPKKSDRSFACLGIMLLELLFGSQLEDHFLWEQLAFSSETASPFYRLLIARQWADSAEDEGGQPFSTAVMWCLNESPTTLDGDMWRKDLADRVVLPLEKCCDWIRGMP